MKVELGFSSFSTFVVDYAETLSLSENKHFSIEWKTHTPLFRIKRFALNEMFQRNAPNLLYFMYKKTLYFCPMNVLNYMKTS